MTAPLPFAWSPSGQRRLRLFAAVGDAPPGRAAPEIPLCWPAKPAIAALDFVLDASGLQSSPADTITVTAAATGVTIDAVAIVGGLIVVWLSGGVAGSLATVDVVARTVSGHLVRRIIPLRIV